MERMKTGVAGLLCFVAVGTVRGENVFPAGDFTEAKDGIGTLAFPNGGRVSLFQEEYSWNKCGKIEIVESTTNEQGSVTWMAGAVIGSDGKTYGFPVRGGAIYDFSVEVRGDAGTVGFGACAWKTGLWKDGNFLKTTISSAPLREKEWTVYRGSFTVPEGMSRGALYLQAWDQAGKGKKARLGPGSHILFDNVKVEESTDGFAAMGRPAKAVETVKSVAPGVTFSDFQKFENATGCVGPSPVSVKGRVDLEDAALLVAVEVRGRDGNAAGTTSSPWSGDCVEALFAPPADDPSRKHTQFAWNAAGAAFAQTGSGRSVPAPEIVASQVKDGVWRSRVRIPYASLGFKSAPKRGTVIGFNLGFTRKVGGYAVWAPVVSGFADVAHFGRLCLGTYVETLKAGWGKDEPVADRAAFEKRVAEIETAARQAELDRFRDAAFTVSVVPAESDFAMPFVPREAFHPVKDIRVRAAVNERTGIPVAVLNVTDKAETYVVRLETNTADPDRDWADKEYNGEWGLAGFPPGQVTARVAIPVKDTESTPVTTRLDPLPKMDEACTVRVGPHEAGLVWFDFDTAGVRPGTYCGRVRVIPLSQPSKFNQKIGYGIGLYEGKMQDVPVTLEVLPIELPNLPSLPSGFFQSPTDEVRFDLMYGVGVSEFSLGPGNFFSESGPTVEEAEKRIRSIRAWAAAKGYEPTFFIGFNCFPQFKACVMPDGDKALRGWPDYIRRIKRKMNAWGVSDAHYNVEVYDEPDPEGYAEVKEVLRLAKESEPTVRLSLTIGARLFSTEQMRGVFDRVDSWVLWSTGCFAGADRQAFIRDALKAGKSVWHYTCSESARNPVYDWYRLHPWYGLRQGLTGNQFFWFQNGWGGYGTTDFKNRLSSGIVLSSFGATMPTLRYMAMRKGVTDLKYLDVLRNLAGDNPEVRKFLAEAPVKVIDTLRYDRKTADRMRDEAVKLIRKYKKGLK